jgi:hypothetical protein
MFSFSVKVEGAQVPFKAPLLELNYWRAKTDQGALTLEKALNYVMNADRDRAVKTFNDVLQAAQDKAGVASGLKALQEKFPGVFNKRFSDKQITEFANTMRERFSAISSTPRSAVGDQ